MFQCNIDKTDRINRAVIGVILFIAAYFGAGLLFFMIVGVILFVQGVVGWCSVPYLMQKFKEKFPS